jgi:hypothetical protein
MQDNVEFVDQDKCVRCYDIARSWFNKDVAGLASEMQKTPKIKSQVQEAASNWDRKQSGEEIAFGSNVSVHTTQRTGMKVESWFWAMPLGQFQQRYALDPVKMKSAVVVPVEDEFTRKQISVVLVRPSQKDPINLTYRKVFFFSDTYWYMDETVMAAMDRLRAAQPADIFSSLSASMNGKRHKAPIFVHECMTFGACVSSNSCPAVRSNKVRPCLPSYKY